MSGLMFTSLSAADLQKQAELVEPAATPRHRSSDGPGWVASVLLLGATAVVGALTASVLFGAAFCFLAHPTDRGISTLAARDRQGLLPTAFPASASALQPKPPGTTGQSVQLAQLAAIAPAFFSGPEPSREEARQNPAPKGPLNASAAVVTGAVSEVRDAMTWVVGGQTVRLWGIRPAPRVPLPDLAVTVGQVSAGGPIDCRRQAYSTRYRCVTAEGKDVAELALLSGIARAAAGAAIAYRDAEAQARQAGKGLWAAW
jgi:endonuclease YncB( thermonuclease family)